MQFCENVILIEELLPMTITMTIKPKFKKGL